MMSVLAGTRKYGELRVQPHLLVSALHTAQLGKVVTTISAQPIMNKRICILDPTNRSAKSSRGIQLKDLFESIPNTSADIYAIKYNHWPCTSMTITLEQVDEDIAKNGKDSNIGGDVHPSVQSIVDYITSHYYGVVIGGNGDHYVMDDSQKYFQVLFPLIKELVKIDFPLLGICWGAQAIIRVIKGDRYISTMREQGKEPQIGIVRYTITNHIGLFKDVQESFFGVTFHQACFLIDDHEKLMYSRDKYWDHQAFRFGKNCFGLQFHPEHTLESVDRLFNWFDNATNEERGIYANINKVMEAEYPDTDIGRVIAKNFLELKR
jgi:GMP synthase-like glutamine amidotransferase